MHCVDKIESHGLKCSNLQSIAAHLEEDSAELDYAGVDEGGDAGGDGDRELGEEGVVGRAPVALEC